MKNETAFAALVSWLIKDTGVVIQLLFALVPVLALLLAGLAIYAVYWKGGRK